MTAADQHGCTMFFNFVLMSKLNQVWFHFIIHSNEIQIIKDHRFLQVTWLGMANSTIVLTPLIQDKLVINKPFLSYLYFFELIFNVRLSIITLSTLETRQLIAEARIHQNSVNWISIHLKPSLVQNQILRYCGMVQAESIWIISKKETCEYIFGIN